MERVYKEMQEKASIYEQICYLLKSLPEQESSSILRTLREGTDAATIIRQVQETNLPMKNKSTSNSGAKVIDSVKGHGGSLQSHTTSWTKKMQSDNMPDGIPPSNGLDQVLFTLDDPEVNPVNVVWTTITNDINLILHLLALYFCWEYPTLVSLSKEHFLRDFRDGRHRYCSSLLLNALLALGCRFFTHLMTRKNTQDSHSAGDHFFKKSQRLSDQEMDHHSLTTIQALGIMSIREASCARGSESRYYAEQSIRLAIEMGLIMAMMRKTRMSLLFDWPLLGRIFVRQVSKLLNRNNE